MNYNKHTHQQAYHPSGSIPRPTHSNHPPNYYPPPLSYHHHPPPPPHPQALPPPPPSLTLQRPSYPHPNSLPPLEHIRPGSTSHPHIPLAPPHSHSHSHPHPHQPPPPHTHPSQSASYPYRRPSYTSSVPHQPSSLRYPAKTSPSSSDKAPLFDLSQYSMSKEDKPKSSGSATSAHSPIQPSPRATRHSSTLPPLQMPSPTPIQSRHAHALSPNDHGLNKKRARDEDVTTPGSEHSRSSSSIFSVTTPSSETAEPALKRRGSNIDALLMSDKDSVDVKPVVSETPNAIPSWNNWERRGSASLASLLTATGTKTSLEKLAEMPIAPPSPITAFPLQFGYTTGGSSSNGPVSGSSNPADRSLNIDPALSSVRSSADQPANSGGNSPQFAHPELRFPEETLNSATASPAINVLEAALQHANASNNANVAESSTSQQDDENRLSVPGSDDPKKEQPFSRSPELRISHKLAERKRRKEMKDLFDELRELLPAERGSKSSKWEILSKAIDFINSIKVNNADLKRDLEKAQRDLDIIRGGSGSGAYTTYPYGTVPYQPPSASYHPIGAGGPGPSNVGVGVSQSSGQVQAPAQNEAQAQGQQGQETAAGESQGQAPRSG